MSEREAGIHQVGEEDAEKLHALAKDAARQAFRAEIDRLVDVLVAVGYGSSEPEPAEIHPLWTMSEGEAVDAVMDRSDSELEGWREAERAHPDHRGGRAHVLAAIDHATGGG